MWMAPTCVVRESGLFRQSKEISTDDQSGTVSFGGLNDHWNGNPGDVDVVNCGC